MVFLVCPSVVVTQLQSDTPSFREGQLTKNEMCL